MEELELLQQAKEALRHAYAPYSGYRVGAALLTVEGRVFKGVNVENISYGLTVCAERNAVAAAISAGCRNFLSLAVASTGTKRPSLPCGACRQVLCEFADDLIIIVAGEKGDSSTFRLQDLLPHSYGRAEKEEEPSQE